MSTNPDDRMLAHLVSALAPHGIGADRLVLTYEDVLQDYDVLILGGDLTDSQIEGLCEATRMGGCLRFEEPRNTTRWDDILRREGTALMKTQAADLRRNHPDLPRFDPSTGTLSDFARSLEVWAGLEPGSVLKVVDERTITMAFSNPPPDFARFNALMQATSVLAEYDIQFWITGEDAV